ncbi:MAG TPA: DNA-3-methyladenine glycosylase I [Rectinemataceae bacterium]
MEHGSIERCPWCGTDPLYMRYHDEEWGEPVHDDARHFEFLLLETQQAGLSWITILRKREAYRRAFLGFDAERVARFTEKDVERLLSDPGIVRNRRKIEASVRNAQAFLEIREKHGSFDDWIWGFVDGKPVDGKRATMADIPVTTSLSDTLSAEMKALGFGFVGSTTIYAHLQAIGIVNDHVRSCFRYAQLKAGRKDR